MSTTLFYLAASKCVPDMSQLLFSSMKQLYLSLILFCLLSNSKLVFSNKNISSTMSELIAFTPCLLASTLSGHLASSLLSCIYFVRASSILTVILHLICQAIKHLPSSSIYSMSCYLAYTVSGHLASTLLTFTLLTSTMPGHLASTLLTSTLCHGI